MPNPFPVATFTAAFRDGQVDRPMRGDRAPTPTSFAQLSHQQVGEGPIKPAPLVHSQIRRASELDLNSTEKKKQLADNFCNFFVGGFS